MEDRKILHIDWKLSEDRYDPQNGAIIHSPDLLRKIADNLTLLNGDFYHVSIKGGGHPFYYDIIGYLAISNMRTRIELDVQVEEDRGEWTKILGKLSPGKLKINMTVPANPGLYKNALEYIASFSTAGQTVVVNPEEEENLLAILKKFRQTVQFEMVGRDQEEECKLIATRSRDTSDRSHHDSAGDPQALYCHMGEQYYSIEPSGHLFTAHCDQGIDLGPFWKLREEDLVSLPTVVKCRQEQCPHSQIFSRKSSNKPIKRISRTLDPTWRVILSEFELLEKSLHIARGENAKHLWDYHFFNENRTHIAEIYSHLADRESRDSFLRSVAAAVTADATCLKNANYTLGAHPGISIQADEIPYWKEGRYCRWFAPQKPIELTRDHWGMLKLHLPKVVWPVNQETVFSIPRQLIELGYKLHWGYHGTDLGMVYAAHPDQLPSTYNSAIEPGLVSIIVPFFNNADTIRRCILSACAQGIDNFEVIAVDDGSSDDSVQIVSKLASLWPRHIRLKLIGKNMGPGYARNLGMSLATGEFMTFIDADDALAPDFLRKSLAIMKEQNADIVAFDLLHIQKGKYPKVWDVKAGVFSGWDSLEQLLLKNAGRYATYSRLYRTEF